MNQKIKVALKIIFTCLFALFIIYFYVPSSGYHVGKNLLTGDPLAHSSEDYCFSFQYPGRWRLYRSGDEGWHGGARPNQRVMVLEPKPYIFGRIYFTIDQIPLNQPILEDVAAWSIANRHKNGQKTEGSPLKSIMVDGKSGLTRTFKDGTDTTTEIYITREADGLILRMSTKSSYHNDALSNFQNLLDTFEFDSCPSS